MTPKAKNQINFKCVFNQAKTMSNRKLMRCCQSS